MKFFISAIASLVTASLLLISAPAFAVNVYGPCNNPDNQNAGQSSLCTASTPTKNPIIVVIKAAIEVVSFIAGAAAVILIIVSAIKFMTSGGDASAVASARGTIVYALVGILVVVLSQAIIAFVLNGLKS